MSNPKEEERLWTLMRQLDRELTLEARNCSKVGGKTTHYTKLTADMVKLKTEYEKVKGTGEYNPMDIKHGEAISARTFKQKMLGKMGPDSHAGMEDR